jgi:excinuclease UvrABC ATPase subunit
MICPECNDRGESIYYVEIDRDENTVTVEQRKGICPTCNGSGEKQQTNADRIRAMSDEELAEFICGIYDEENGGVYQDECGKFINGTVILDYDQYKIAEWLKQPAETPTTNANTCVCCGAIIPEGKMVCPSCLVTVKEGE